MSAVSSTFVDQLVRALSALTRRLIRAIASQDKTLLDVTSRQMQAILAILVHSGYPPRCVGDAHSIIDQLTHVFKAYADAPQETRASALLVVQIIALIRLIIKPIDFGVTAHLGSVFDSIISDDRLSSIALVVTYRDIAISDVTGVCCDFTIDKGTSDAPVQVTMPKDPGPITDILHDFDAKDSESSDSITVTWSAAYLKDMGSLDIDIQWFFDLIMGKAI